MKSGMIWNIREYGAVADARTVNTVAIQNTIDYCHEAGGGTVLIEGGIYVCGTIFLRSNVTLEIAQGTVLRASPDIRDYAENVHHNRYRNEEALDRCFLYGEDLENIGICGTGCIEGNSCAFPNDGSIYRPMMLRFLRCKQIHIEDVKLCDAAAWTTAFLDSEYIWINRVYIHNEKRYNGDGLDFDGCAHVFIDNCGITGTDDNLCLQSSSKEHPVKDIHINSCEFSSLCAGIRIGLKSIGDICNVVISNCTMDRVWREGIKIECTEGGSISNIAIQNVTMRDVTRPVFMILNNRFRTDDYGSSVELKQMPEIGSMENIAITNLAAVDSEEMKNIHYRFGNDIMGEPKFNGIRIDAEEHHPICGVTLQNIRYHSIGGVRREEIPAEYPPVLDQLLYPGEVTSENYYPDWSRAAYMDIRNVYDLILDNICFNSTEPDEREAYFIENSQVIRQDIRVIE